MESYNEDDSSEEKTKLLIKSIDAPTIVNVSFFSNQLHLINKIELFTYITYIMVSLLWYSMTVFIPSMNTFQSNAISFISIYFSSNIFIDIMIALIIFLNISAFYFYSVKLFSLSYAFKTVFNMITMSNIRPMNIYKENMIYMAIFVSTINVIYLGYICFYVFKVYTSNIELIYNQNTIENIVHEINLRKDMLKMKINEIIIRLHLNKVLKHYMFSKNDFYFMRQSSMKSNISTSRCITNESTLMTSISK